MEMESYFVDGVLLVAAVALLMGLESGLEKRFAVQRRALHRLAGRFEHRHPRLCDVADTFYCFFRRDAFHRR